MSADLRTTEDPHAQRLAELAAQVAQLQAQLAAREARIADLEAQLAAATRAGKRQATPFARRHRNPHPPKPGRKSGQGSFASRPGYLRPALRSGGVRLGSAAGRVDCVAAGVQRP